MNKLRRIVGITALLFSQSLLAQLAVDRIIVDFDDESPNRNDVQLINTSETDTLFVSVEVLEVTDPGTAKEKRVVVDDPAKIGLVATPNRVILPPGNRRLVRLVNLFPTEDQERIFRVNFSPVVGESDEAGVKILVGYQALIIVRPEKTVFDLVGKREGNTLTVTNNSNTNVYVSNIRQCDNKESEECTRYVETRLYPGNVWELDLTGKGALSFNADDGTDLREMTF